MLSDPLVLVDLETTGAHAQHDRVTEVGLLLIDNGRVIEEWETLVNPHRAIPPHIALLTGITDQMVALAPSFDEIARILWEKLDGRTLVAHNARFDHGFLRSEFARLERRYTPKVVCTVKLSRKLYPEHRRHNLDSLLARHAITCTARHRALGDARVLWSLLTTWAGERGGDALAAAARGQALTPSLPPHLSDLILDEVPETPGVYLFYGENDLPLYVGKSVNLRARVLGHFAGDRTSAKESRIVQQVKRIDWRETAGELGALLEEARLVKTLSPLMNRRLRAERDACTFRWALAPGGAPEIVSLDVLAERDTPYGVFATRKAALDALRGIARERCLCYMRLGLEKGSGPCFGYQIKRCRGVCVGSESIPVHDLRVAEALAAIKLPAWPFRGAVAVRERAGDQTQVHLLDNWRHIGTAHSDEALATLTEQDRAVRFDLDTFRILQRFLAAPPRGARIVALGELAVPALAGRNCALDDASTAP